MLQIIYGFCSLTEFMGKVVAWQSQGRLPEALLKGVTR